MRLPRLAPVVLFSAVALAGCGSSNLLDGSSAEDLQASISRVEQAVRDGRCEQAMAAATEGLKRVEALPSSVDGKLRSRLRQGFEELEQRIPSDCNARETTTTEPPPTTTDAEPPATTDVEPPPTTTETPTETTPTETTPTAPPDTTTDEVPLGDDDSGGTPPDDSGTDEIDPATPRGLRELQQGMRELRDSGRDARKAAREARKQFDQAIRDAGKALRGDR